MKEIGETVEILGKEFEIVRKPTPTEVIWLALLELEGHHAERQIKKWDVQLQCLDGFNNHRKQYFHPSKKE